jgi:hypothetical protein
MDSNISKASYATFIVILSVIGIQLTRRYHSKSARLLAFTLRVECTSRELSLKLPKSRNLIFHG